MLGKDYKNRQNRKKSALILVYSRESQEREEREREFKGHFIMINILKNINKSNINFNCNNIY